MRTAKTLIRLDGCPGWSESSLGAHSFCWFCHVAVHLVSMHSFADYCFDVFPTVFHKCMHYCVLDTENTACIKMILASSRMFPSCNLIQRKMYKLRKMYKCIFFFFFFFFLHFMHFSSVWRKMYKLRKKYIYTFFAGNTFFVVSQLHGWPFVCCGSRDE